MSLLAKASDLSTDFERLFIKAKIITDIRPIFNDERTEILATAVTSTMRLDYITHDGDDGTMSVVLDISDLNMLRDECDKALHKLRTSRDRMEGAGISTFIGGEEADDE